MANSTPTIRRRLYRTFASALVPRRTTIAGDIGDLADLDEAALTAAVVRLVPHLQQSATDPAIRTEIIFNWALLPAAIRQFCVQQPAVNWLDAILVAAESPVPTHRLAAAVACVELSTVSVDQVLPRLIEDADPHVAATALDGLRRAVASALDTGARWESVCDAVALAADGIDRHRRRETAELLVLLLATPASRAAATAPIRAIMADDSHPIHLAARAIFRKLPESRAADLAWEHLTARPWSAATQKVLTIATDPGTRLARPYLALNPRRSARWQLPHAAHAQKLADEQRVKIRATALGANADPWGDSDASRIIARRLLKAQPGGMIEEALTRLKSADAATAFAAVRWIGRMGLAGSFALDLARIAAQAIESDAPERQPIAAAIASALRDADDPASLDLLWTLSQNADPRVCSAAIESLARRAVRAGAWSAVREDLLKLADDDRHRVRATALWLLGRVEPASALPLLQVMLTDPARMHRVAALWALDRLLRGGSLCPDPALWAALIATISGDHFAQVRTRAARCLEALALGR